MITGSCLAGEPSLSEVFVTKMICCPYRPVNHDDVACQINNPSRFLFSRSTYLHGSGRSRRVVAVPHDPQVAVNSVLYVAIKARLLHSSPPSATRPGSKSPCSTIFTASVLLSPPLPIDLHRRYTVISAAAAKRSQLIATATSAVVLCRVVFVVVVCFKRASSISLSLSAELHPLHNHNQHHLRHLQEE